MSKHTPTSRFAITGRFARFAIEDGFKIKGFYLAVSGEEVYIKLPKRLRYYCADLLVPGALLQVRGKKKVDLKRDRVKLKAEDILSAIATPGHANGHWSQAIEPARSREDAEDVAKPQCIRVCQKSSCCKRGGAAVWQALERGIAEAGLGDRVKLKATSCMGKCKAGPNLIMPGKMRYSHVKAQSVSDLLEEHFTSPAPRA
ncbi:(2Fe-2S) ferredoxin domain-containing protein [Synechococcus sp. PCC 7336]|uniref:(2Fe-2S) ferredoxin domain-containing protein n=1 Tax=Synechococcus sp. PCC 7336 TaxID=195250 RepID=UPI000344B027|nr:(2Fe-2S) ferredoxin domain-containing protein [Synechococcus sp. PCC 7336]